MAASISNLSHKSLYSSTPILAANPRSPSYSFSTPPLSPSPRTGLRNSSVSRAPPSPLLRSSLAHLHASPLKDSPPLSDKVPTSFQNLLVKVTHAFHNNFYALRISILIKGEPVELKVSREVPVLYCKNLTCSIAFRPIFDKLQQLLKEFGVSCFLRCFSDPLPLIEIAVDTSDAIKRLLLNRDEIMSYIWVMVCNEFISMSNDIGVALLKDESRDLNAVRFQLTHRPGNNCSIDLFMICPNCHQREVEIYPITLANLDHASKLMMSSLIFDFPTAMSSFLISSRNPLLENVSLEDLKAELKELTNWFHMGIYLDFKPSVLMNTLFNCRKIDACRSQFLSAWHSQQASAIGDNLLTWTEIVAVVADIGQRCIADSIVKKFGMKIDCNHVDYHMHDFGALITEGMDVNAYHETLKQQEKGKESMKVGYLNSEPLGSLVDEMKEIDFQMAEKMKPLKTYELQKKNLELSVNEVFKILNKSIEDVREKSDERRKLKEAVSKAKIEITALETALKQLNVILETDATGQPEMQKSTADVHELSISNILEEKITQCQRYQNKIAGLSKQIKDLVKEITEQRDSLVKEHQLLLSKCQQIHQLQGVTSLLRTKINAFALKIDQALQQKCAANSMFKSSVFQLHIDALTQELKGKESQLTLFSAREKRAQKMATEAQEKLEEMDLNEETGEMTLQGAEGEEDEDKRLDEWVKPVVESVELRNKLLKAKMSHWNNERSKRITSAEGKALTQMLNAMKETTIESDEKIVIEDIDADDTAPKLECTLKPNQGYKAVKANTLIKFTIELDPSTKLNMKKFNYRVDVKSIANNSISPVNFTPNLTTGAGPQTLSFNFRPSVRGRHQVLIWCNNKPLKGAGACAFQAKLSPTLLGYPVRVISGLSYPYNVCSVPNTQILLVSESKGRKVMFIDKSSGNKVLKVGMKGLMKIPNGIAVTEEGTICVVDSGNHCICLFTPQGVPLGKFGVKGDAFNEFFFPYGIKTSPFDKSICVCDHNNDRIQVFTKDLSFQRALHAASPYDVAYDSKKCMYVTDRRNHLIAVFNEKDQCIHSISGKGSEEGKIHEPRGIAIDEQDHIYVVEERNCRVSVFDTLGQFITSFGNEGLQPGEFQAPQGICIDEDGYIYICDMLNNRIQVF